MRSFIFMIPYKLYATNRFKKDYKKIQKRKNFRHEDFHQVVTLLQQGKKLPKKYFNHLLEPKSDEFYECHIKPDCLLIYHLNPDMSILTLVRIGSHSDLFN